MVDRRLGLFACGLVACVTLHAAEPGPPCPYLDDSCRYRLPTGRYPSYMTHDRFECTADTQCAAGEICLEEPPWRGKCVVECDEDEDCWRFSMVGVLGLSCASLGAGPREEPTERGACHIRYDMLVDDSDYDTMGFKPVLEVGDPPRLRESGGVCADDLDCSAGSRCQDYADVVALGDGAPETGTCVPRCHHEADCVQFRGPRSDAACVAPGEHGYCEITLHPEEPLPRRWWRQISW